MYFKFSIALLAALSFVYSHSLIALNVYNVTGSGTFCEGSTFSVRLTGSESGINYSKFIFHEVGGDYKLTDIYNFLTGALISETFIHL